MEIEGFRQRPNEWWHFDYKDGAYYEVLNFSFDQIPPRNNYVLPKVVYRVEPEYTDAARKVNFNGTIKMECVITKEGRIEVLRIINPVGYGLEENAINAIHRWKLDPALKDGKPISMKVTVEVAFKRW